MKIVIFSIIIIIFSQLSKSQIVINEICASNFRNFYDEDNDDPDWIELYNSSDKAVNLKGWKIFDKKEIENAFVLPDTILQAKERIVIFASGKNRYTSNKIYAKTTGLGIMAHVKGTYVHYLYIPINGDFETELIIDKVNADKNFPSAGILFKEKLDFYSKFYAIVSSNKKRSTVTTFYGYNEEEYPIQYLSGFTESPLVKVKLIKKENIIKSYLLFHDGVTWFERSSDTLDFTNGYLGISFGGEDYKNEIFSDFLVSNFIINGKEYFYSDLMKFDLGIPNNLSASFILNEIHLNFALSKEGENLYLWNADNELIDNVNFSKQFSNLTFSRYPDGNNNFYFSVPTPMNENNYGVDSIINPPFFSENSSVGKQLNKVEILHNSPNVEIYYTLDGSEPTKNSYFYQNQISLDTAVVIRAKAFLDDALCFEDAVFTYNPLYNSGLPYISLITDTNNLYNPYNGIININNLYLDFETKVYFDYIDNDINFKTLAGIRLHGGGTRFFYPQKSFRLYPRYEIKDEFNFSFWDEYESSFSNKLILKNGGQDWSRSFIKDIFFQNLSKLFLKDIEFFSSVISISYINNKFYGITDLKERIDEDYLMKKYNIEEKNKINLKMNSYLKNGSFDEYFHLFDNLNLADTSKKIEIVKKYFDINNILNYAFINIFSANDDWPFYNEMVWNCNELDLKWRWIPNDFDLTMVATHNSFEYSNTLERIKSTNSEFSNILSILLLDNNFKYNFANFFADKLNYNFSFNYTYPIYDSLINLIKPVVYLQKNNYPNSLIDFDKHITYAESFLKNRPKYMFQHIVEEFNQSGTTDIHLSQNIENAGVFHLNSLEISDESWTGTYFNEIPISISVKSNPGYRFIGWQDIENKDSILSDILIAEYNKFHAVFEKTGDPINNKNRHLVINEIMYKAKDNMKCGDWIELYNNNNNDVDLSNWIIQDKKLENTYTIPENTIIKKYDYLIIAQDILDFKSYYGISNNIVGDFDFGFGESDLIKLFDNSYNLIDKVEYSNKNPWDINADGTGYSLELIHHNYDNSLPWNWKASISYSGTPLESNSTFITEVESTNEAVSIYPNPVNDFLTIELKDNTFSKLKVFDLLGNELFSNSFNSSIINLDFNEYSSAIYVIRIYDSNNNIILNTKIIKK